MSVSNSEAYEELKDKILKFISNEIDRIKNLGERTMEEKLKNWKNIAVNKDMDGKNLMSGN